MRVDNLPAPDSIAKQYSDRLRDRIIAEIQAKGPITFERYMQQALYAPGLGYYSAGSKKFGETGDFVTAPEISSLYSRCIARQCQQVLTDLKGGNILELGAGSGVMALDILQELEAHQRLPDHYYILELSADLHDRQKSLFQTKAPRLLSKVAWLNRLPTHFKGVIIGNEVIDAMPVHRFKQQSGIQEFYVDYQDDQFCWHLAKPCRQELLDKIKALDVDFKEGYESEINLLLAPWIASLSDALEQGLILLIDYGFPRQEYYHEDRSMGTLMCHYRHHAHPDPLINLGIQDITAHVDFTAVAEAAVANHLEVVGYTHQAGFLLGCGIDSMMPDISDTKWYYNVAQQVKRLTLPSEMGELFKVIGLTKCYDDAMLGFSIMNQLEKL